MMLGKPNASTSEDNIYLVRFRDDPGPVNFTFLRRATRLRRELYEALGACTFTSPARFLGGSNVT